MHSIATCNLSSKILRSSSYCSRVFMVTPTLGQVVSSPLESDFQPSGCGLFASPVSCSPCFVWPVFPCLILKAMTPNSSLTTMGCRVSLRLLGWQSSEVLFKSYYDIANEGEFWLVLHTCDWTDHLQWVDVLMGVVFPGLHHYFQFLKVIDNENQSAWYETWKYHCTHSIMLPNSFRFVNSEWRRTVATWMASLTNSFATYRVVVMVLSLHKMKKQVISLLEVSCECCECCSSCDRIPYTTPKHGYSSFITDSRVNYPIDGGYLTLIGDNKEEATTLLETFKVVFQGITLTCIRTMVTLTNKPEQLLSNSQSTIPTWNCCQLWKRPLNLIQLEFLYSHSPLPRKVTLTLIIINRYPAETKAVAVWLCSLLVLVNLFIPIVDEVRMSQDYLILLSRWLEHGTNHRIDFQSSCFITSLTNGICWNWLHVCSPVWFLDFIGVTCETWTIWITTFIQTGISVVMIVPLLSKLRRSDNSNWRSLLCVS